MNLPIKIFINTCKKYKEITIPKILNDIEIYKFPKENIIIFSGQEDDEKTYIENNITFINVPYCGFQNTALIYVSENYDKFEHLKYILNLPDTIDLGKNTWKNFLAIYYRFLLKENINAIPFAYDIGILRIKYIHFIKSFLTSGSCKALPPITAENITKLKWCNLFFEDSIYLKPRYKTIMNKKINNEFYLVNEKMKKYIKHKIENFDIFILQNKYNLKPFYIDSNNKLYITKEYGKKHNYSSFIAYVDLKKYIQSTISPVKYW